MIQRNFSAHHENYVVFVLDYPRAIITIGLLGCDTRFDKY